MASKKKNKKVDPMVQTQEYIDFLKRAIDSEYLESLFDEQNGKCGITGIVIKLPNKNDDTKIYETASLDRINNKLGYIKNNVRWVVLGINYMKNRHSDEDVITLIDKIKSH